MIKSHIATKLRQPWFFMNPGVLSARVVVTIDGRSVSFLSREKPVSITSSSVLVNGGVYVLNPECISLY